MYLDDGGFKTFAMKLGLTSWALIDRNGPRTLTFLLDFYIRDLDDNGSKTLMTKAGLVSWALMTLDCDFGNGFFLSWSLTMRTLLGWKLGLMGLDNDVFWTLT